MRITDLLKNKAQNVRDNKPVTIAFIGDSVTQGCFECFTKSEGGLEIVYEYKNSYPTRVGEILNTLYPSVQINIINSGISGDSAPGGASRFERDVLSYNPDLVVISFGLNDSTKGLECLSDYTEALEEMFSTLNSRGIETVFLTENTMCTDTSPYLNDELLVSLSKRFADIQNEGVLKQYFEAAKASALKYGVTVCDLYAVWESMITAGVSTTALLSNKLNHPLREIHGFMAMKIVETILMN